MLIKQFRLQAWTVLVLHAINCFYFYFYNSFIDNLYTYLLTAAWLVVTYTYFITLADLYVKLHAILPTWRNYAMIMKVFIDWLTDKTDR